MIGIILGLGFQWWPNLQYSWQYIAFIFVYLDIVDYWIDYSPSLKKFPPKQEIDFFIDIAIMFSLFLYIYATQLTIIYFLTTFIVFRVLDYFWLLRSKYEYKPIGDDKLFVDTWLLFNLIEGLVSAIIIGSVIIFQPSSLSALLGFIIFRIAVRIFTSFRYKKIHFA